MAGRPDAAADPSADNLVAISTHDTPAFAAWWKGSDIDDLAALGVFDEDRASRERTERMESVARVQDRFGTEGVEATRDAVLAWMAGTDAAVALVNLDDLLLEERRQNVPGTDTERPNWRLRHDRSVDDLGADDEFAGSLAALVAIRHSG
jgi:4-alpha-glucanotransferase